ncbi:MAG: hypothetical protein LW817_00050 [Candidatus Caenarcaniphilales bacterium]|jgi:hypothetical protein|nr:hypothetical protein [Candidatus Caenarcaniphilales bacterium]
MTLGLRAFDMFIEKITNGIAAVRDKTLGVLSFGFYQPKVQLDKTIHRTLAEKLAKEI